MSSENGFTEEEIRDMSQKAFRKEFPSGWMEVSRYETLVLVIDALLESAPNREFGIDDLAENAGVVPVSVESHIGSLVRLGVVEEIKGSNGSRYSLNTKSPITQDLFDLNLTVERVKDGELPKSLNREDRLPSDADNYNTADDGASGHRRIATSDMMAISAD